LDTNYLQKVEDKSLFTSSALVYNDTNITGNCNGDKDSKSYKECGEVYDTFPLFNMIATEFETQARKFCILYIYSLPTLFFVCTYFESNC